jgi:hypothetical protein
MLTKLHPLQGLMLGLCDWQFVLCEFYVLPPHLLDLATFYLCSLLCTVTSACTTFERLVSLLLSLFPGRLSQFFHLTLIYRHPSDNHTTGFSQLIDVL